ncbi:MAG: hypothetical protein AMXMBFR57_20230 [Acidimicrobiia bacterium]
MEIDGTDTAYRGAAARWGLLQGGPQVGMPLSTFVIKMSSRCNLDCDYCYVYHSKDDSWKRQPKAISTVIIDSTLERIEEHVRAHALPSVSLVLHGGEPLLAGLDVIEYLLKRATELLGDVCFLELSMQSNGTLLSKEAIDLFAKYDAAIGISIDGYEDANRHRVFRDGRPSFRETHQAIQLLTSDDTGRRVLSGLLAVVDPRTDPLAVFDYLASHKPRSLDFLLPYATHDAYPKGKVSFNDTTYGDWLVAVFDRWFLSSTQSFRIKYFDNIIALLLGGKSETECLGHPPVNIVTIETNGDIEALDSLKVAYDGVTKLNLNVQTDSLDDAIGHPAILSRMQGTDTLAAECRRCPLVDVCGGGYLPHRFSTRQGFLNPSVFCHDIAKVVLHVRQALLQSVSGGQIDTPESSARSQ